jgi:Fic family protein
MKYTQKEVDIFLKESNKIEREDSKVAFEDAQKAWDYLKTKEFLTPEIILGTHHLLMRNLRPDIAGFWRTCDVWIGGVMKPFTTVKMIEKRMKNFCTMVNTKLLEIEPDVLDQLTKDAHVRFEDLHPFEDGNGRTGRLIYLWHRQKLGLPIHIIHADWPKDKGEQMRYYQWFRGNGNV